MIFNQLNKFYYFVGHHISIFMLDRIRIVYATLAIVTMVLGLFSRSKLWEPPEFVILYVGDALWALLVFWLVCFLIPNRKNTTAVLVAVVFSFSIECSQLYQAEWINEIRHTKLGALVLGFGFKWSDLVAYVVGILLGASLRFFVDGRVGQWVQYNKKL